MDEKMSVSRNIIDEADREIAKLFEKRMEAVKEIANYKQAHGLPVRDAQREQEILTAVSEKAGKYERYAYDLFSFLLELSRKRQTELRMSGTEYHTELRMSGTFPDYMAGTKWQN